MTFFFTTNIMVLNRKLKPIGVNKNFSKTQAYIELLKRMTFDIQGIRPPLISRALWAALEELRAFRDMFRHAYSYDIDPEKLRLVMDKFVYIEKTYKEDLRKFMNLLETPSA